MFHHARRRGHAAVAALALAAALGAAPAAMAETPPDTLIQAWAIDDVISLDPAEVFEFTASEILGNSYQGLVGYDVNDVSDVFGVLAESWEVSEDGKTFTFTMRPGLEFASGNPITAADPVYSLRRAVKLDKSPAFILTQFGLTADNVDERVRQTGEMTFELEMDQPYAPTLLLYSLTATVGFVVDSALVQEHEQDGDFGYEWLKTNYAGSGPFVIREWRANEAVVLERNPNFSGEMGTLERAIYRHIPEAATQRLLLEQADVDIARNLGAEEIAALADAEGIDIESGVKGSIYYMGLNQRNEALANPQVREAMKYLVDYQAIADTIMAGKVKVHQTYLPEGFLGALDEAPYSLDVEKAKELLAEAGYPGRLHRHHGHPQLARDHRDGAGDPADHGGRGHHAGADPRRRAANADQVPRPQPRHLHRPLGPGLPGPQHQRRDLLLQPRQLGRRRREAAGLAQRLGDPRALRAHRRRLPGARRGREGAAVPGSPARGAGERALRDHVPGGRGPGDARRRGELHHRPVLQRQLVPLRDQGRVTGGRVTGGRAGAR